MIILFMWDYLQTCIFVLDMFNRLGVNLIVKYEKIFERSALLMSIVVFITPDAVGKLPSRSAPVDRN